MLNMLNQFCPCPEPFHLVPFPSAVKQPDKLKAWIRCVNRQSWLPNPDTRICTEHFLDDHPYPVVRLGHNNIPQQYQVPNRRPPPKRICNHLESAETQGVGMLDDSDDQYHTSTLQCKDVLKGSLSFHDYDYNWQDVGTCEGCFIRSAKISSLLDTLNQYKSTSWMSVKSPAKIDESDSMFMDSKIMMTYTGMDRITFDTIFAVVSHDAKKMRYWKGPQRTVNSIKKYTPGPKRVMKAKNEFLMAMMKLRTGLHMTILGSLFGVSPSHVSRTCFTWWRFLSHAIGSLVYNPEKYAVMATRPQAFKETPYSDVRHIIDATEIFIETPKSLELAASCWSDYKHHYTVKYLISINPNGHINYVSKGWSGRTSDNHQTKHCGFLDVVEPFDKVRNTCIKCNSLSRALFLNCY